LVVVGVPGTAVALKKVIGAATTSRSLIGWLMNKEKRNGKW
jgi:hypothetical protein